MLIGLCHFYPRGFFVRHCYDSIVQKIKIIVLRDEYLSVMSQISIKYRAYPDSRLLDTLLKEI